MKRLYFMRHGLSEANKQKIFSGNRETPLSDEGKQQAKAAGKKAKHEPIDLIITSPRSRAHDTAKIVATEIGYPHEAIIVYEKLHERDYGTLEGTEWTPELSAQLKNASFGDVESIESMLMRAQEALDFARSHQGKNILIVAHGSLGRALRHHAVPEADFHAGIPNAELVRWI